MKRPAKRYGKWAVCAISPHHAISSNPRRLAKFGILRVVFAFLRSFFFVVVVLNEEYFLGVFSFFLLGKGRLKELKVVVYADKHTLIVFGSEKVLCLK